MASWVLRIAMAWVRAVNNDRQKHDGEAGFKAHAYINAVNGNQHFHTQSLSTDHGGHNNHCQSHHGCLVDTYNNGPALPEATAP